MNIQIASGGGFGYTFSKEKIDIDSNNYNDFGIGIPFDNKAIIVKTHKVFEFKPVSLFSEYDAAINPKINGKCISNWL